MSQAHALSPGQQQRIKLRHLQGAAGGYAHLRELCGADELALDGVDTRAAISLLARLVQVERAAQGKADDPATPLLKLPAADRDHLLAALHRRCWGDHIVSSLHCPACSAQFDLSFSLIELQRSLIEQGQQWLAQQAANDDATHAANDINASLANLAPPSGQQELAAQQALYADDAARALQALYPVNAAANSSFEPGQLEPMATWLEHSAPLLDLELDAACAECGHLQQTHFDVQSFVLQRLLNERDLLLQEIHTLARGYGWPLAEILALPRSQRRRFVQLLTGEAA